ncbi:EF-hand domain-containing protein [Aphelenchoides fujianensis]|nr:EF-hand domain-containing protein [Aphelenchoides fujianensis]
MKIRSLILISRTSLEAESGCQTTNYQSKSQFGLDVALLPIQNDVENICGEKEEPLEQVASLRAVLARISGKAVPDRQAKTNTIAERSAVENNTQDTTILYHLFGKNGRNALTFEQFQMFYRNLQTELIEIEFHEFARGKQEITSTDFARLVFRYTILQSSDQLAYIRRITQKLADDDRGITLQQFEQFSIFLNNLEDFTRAIKLYLNANIGVSQSEFIRAVKCSTGLILDAHLVDVLFKIFDTNDDGELSYAEFIQIMNDRLSRGFKNQTRKMTSTGWRAFKTCIIREMATV